MAYHISRIKHHLYNLQEIHKHLFFGKISNNNLNFNRYLADKIVLNS